MNGTGQLALGLSIISTWSREAGPESDWAFVQHSHKILKSFLVGICLFRVKYETPECENY